MDVLNITGYLRRIPHVVAEHKGFFTQENLQVRFHETTYAPDHNKGMAAGRWDFTLSSADTMIARTTTDGVDYQLFMQAEEGLSAYLIGQPGVDSIDKLRGKLLPAILVIPISISSARKFSAPTAWTTPITISKSSAARRCGSKLFCKDGWPPPC
jgi:hypothetical protein